MGSPLPRDPGHGILATGLLLSEGESRVCSGTEIWFQLTPGQSILGSQVMVIKGRGLYLGNGRPGMRGTEAPKATFFEGWGGAWGRRGRAGCHVPVGMTRPDSPVSRAAVSESRLALSSGKSGLHPSRPAVCTAHQVSPAVDHGLGPTSQEQGAGRGFRSQAARKAVTRLPAPKGWACPGGATPQPGALPPKCHSRSSRRQ